MCVRDSERLISVTAGQTPMISFDAANLLGGRYEILIISWLFLIYNSLHQMR